MKPSSLVILLLIFIGAKAELSPDIPAEIPNDAGLTQQQKLVIRETWTRMQKDFQEKGVEFFVSLFKDHPTFQKKFKSFANVSLEDLPGNKRLQTHASRFMDTLSEIIRGIDDIVGLTNLLIRLGEIHAKQQVAIQEFQVLEAEFTEFLQKKLGDDFTVFAKESWQQMFQMMNPIVEQGMNHNSKR